MLHRKVGQKQTSRHVNQSLVFFPAFMGPYFGGVFLKKNQINLALGNLHQVIMTVSMENKAKNKIPSKKNSSFFTFDIKKIHFQSISCDSF